MLCMLGTGTEKTLEEYRKSLQKQSIIFIIFAFLGVASILGTIFLPIDPHLQGFYSGVGTGILAACLVKLFSIRKILKDEELLKKKKTESTDERNIAISANAIRLASFIMIIVCYISMFISSIYNMTVFWCLWFVVMLFFLLYVAFVFYYRRKL